MALTGATNSSHTAAARQPASLSRLQKVSNLTLGIVTALTGLHIFTALLFLFGSASGEAAAWDRLPGDDSWTRLTYIRNFADSFAFQYNDGDSATGATSPLWVALNGTFAAVFGVSDGALPALVKVTGVLFGIASVWMAFRITWQITRKRYFGLLAGATLAVEPNFGFAAVSGTEVTMFAALSLAASWAYLRGRMRTAGIFTALAIATRPEGFLLAMLVIVATLARWMWRRDGAILERQRDVQDIAWLGVPSLFVVVAWVSFNWSVTGNALPDSYLATTESIGLLPLSNLWNIWLGYLHQLPFMDGLAWVIGLPLILLGIYVVVSRHSFSSIPVTLFTVAMIYAAMITFTRPDDAWMFDNRRHMDVALPFIVILLVVGIARSWQLVWLWERARKPLTDRERKAVLVTGVVAAAALVIAPLAALPVRWDALTSEYSWTARNTNDVQVAMGRWLNENTPESAVIGAVPAGAISFFTDRRILDLSGKSTHEAQDQAPLTFGLEQEVDYLVAFREPFFDNIPNRAVVNEERVSFANAFQSNILRAYGPPGSSNSIEVDREELQLIVILNSEIIDTLDVGNQFAVRSATERIHDYGTEGERVSSTITMNIGDGSVLTDDFRSFSGAEEFVVASRPGVPLIIVKRYDATVSTRLRVFADGFEAGTWDLPVERAFFGENSFVVPSHLITQNRTSLRFEVIPGPDSLAASSFFYWILVPTEQSSPQP